MLGRKQLLCCQWMLLHHHISISYPFPFLWWETREENKITAHLVQFNESFPTPSACSIDLVIRLYYVSFNVLETVPSKCWQHFTEKSHHHTHHKKQCFDQYSLKPLALIPFHIRCTSQQCYVSSTKIKRGNTAENSKCKLSPFSKNFFGKP